MSRLRTILTIDPARWTPARLGRLTAADLAGLATLLGIATSGTKAVRVDRILAAVALRRTLSPVADPQQLAQAYRRAELRAFARTAGTYRWSTKYGIAAGLLRWRDDCRRRGLAAYQAARGAAQTQPRQLMMNIEVSHGTNTNTDL